MTAPFNLDQLNVTTTLSAAPGAEVVRRALVDAVERDRVADDHCVSFPVGDEVLVTSKISSG
jgi:hypothetical protein